MPRVLAEPSRVPLHPKPNGSRYACAAATDEHSSKRAKPTDPMTTMTAPLLVKRCNRLPPPPRALMGQILGQSTPGAPGGRLSETAKIPVRGSRLAAGYDLSSAYDYVVPARGKELVKTDLEMAIPEGCYGRVGGRPPLHSLAAPRRPTHSPRPAAPRTTPHRPAAHHEHPAEVSAQPSVCARVLAAQRRAQALLGRTPLTRGRA